jgi:hypothetical protein
MSVETNQQEVDFLIDKGHEYALAFLDNIQNDKGIKDSLKMAAAIAAISNILAFHIDHAIELNDQNVLQAIEYTLNELSAKLMFGVKNHEHK